MTQAKDLEFEKIVEQYVEYSLKAQPVMASFLGVHKYDEEFSDMSAGGIARHLSKLADFKKKLKDIQKRYLSEDNKVDYDLLQSKVDLELILAGKYPLYKILPDLYLNEVLFGVYVIITREFDTPRERGILATRRLAQIPNMLRNARKNISNPPRVFVESAIHTCQGARLFLQTSLVEFATCQGGMLGEAMLEANDEAVSALESFEKFLEEELPKCKDKFAVGKTVYNQILRYQHQLPYSSDDLIKIAKKVIKQTEKELEETAAKIAKNKSWQDIVEKLKADHPTAKTLVRTYEKEMKRARKFVEQNDLVSIPEGEDIEVVPTPPFAQMLIPYAAYISPAPMDTVQKGIFWVTVPDNLARGEASKRLLGHSKWGIPVTALHEAYPGHHLQLTKANQRKNLLRHIITTSVFAEGWALYCEEMMYEQGFYTDPKERLLQLKDNLWRAYRVLIDVGLHTGTMTIDEAVKTLVEKAGLEEPNADAEVRRYCQDPTQPMSYIIGKHLIQQILAAYKRNAGKEFKLKDFHEKLLACGTIPPTQVAALMGLGAINFK